MSLPAGAGVQVGALGLFGCGVERFGRRGLGFWALGFKESLRALGSTGVVFG